MKSVYFAADEAQKTVSYLKEKADSWFKHFISNRYLDKVKDSWKAYHGDFYSESHDISYGGEQGELVNLPVNHFRSIGTVMVNMVTANRPAFQPRSANLDSKSEIQTTLAHGLLEYYMREKRIERLVSKSVEYAAIMSAGYIKINWNSTSGQIYDYVDPQVDENGEIPIDPATGEPYKPFPVYEGDIEAKILSPLDVVFDPTKETFEDNQWILTRTFVNKYDLAAKYPELREKILSVKTKDENKITYSLNKHTTDDVPMYEFSHKSTEALPNGRFILYLDEECILEDTRYIYKGLNIFRITPAEYLGTPFGYTVMFDLLPLQKFLNSSYSTIATNHAMFGVTNVLNPEGNNIRLEELRSGMNIINYNAQAGAPTPLTLTQTPAEIFNFMAKLTQDMELISGMNAVARGNPESALKSGSGTALALVQSQALQFISGLQRSYIQLLEDLGTGIINLLKDFASVPRIASIAGATEKYKIVEFSSEDLQDINRVVVNVGNPLAQTTAGRLQMSEQLMQMKGDEMSISQYLEVMNTGNLTAMTNVQNNEALLIRSENEHLMNGDILVKASALDRHKDHILSHRGVGADPTARAGDPDLIRRVNEHVMEHIYLLQTTDPNVLAMIGEQPLAPPGGSPVAPETAALPNIPQESLQGMEELSAPETAGVATKPNELSMPGESPKKILPTPAQPPKNALPTGYQG